ncbi:MAG: hypothetical protein P0119_12580 [Nitrospira sp.]|nr:hypothetical protein [Nitrospira sp.]
MKPDPIVDEVRKTREAHAAKFNYDLFAICSDLRKKERKRIWSSCCVETTKIAAKTNRKLTRCWKNGVALLAGSAGGTGQSPSAVGSCASLSAAANFL